MKKISLLLYLFLHSSYCTNYNSNLKGFSILQKFKSSRIIEIKINAPFDQEIVNIFNKLKKEDQQITIYFNRHTFLGLENKNKVFLESSKPITGEKTTYYTVEIYKIVGLEIFLYPMNYSKLAQFISFYTFGLIPTTEEFDITMKLSVTNSIYETNTKVASADANILLHHGIYYNLTDKYKDNKEGILNSYEVLARYILN
ncbi:hypothetical protein JWG41_02950 [Leptospira sp. 201903075]|uniref:hypothetical protein n=1 Tax=Leptospira chreensis TaxID=2810035 RepID=UPI00196455E1|nr:hypothetical protein [Leptospira chreensis]MBM9589388.1 hypothetical protein [Leptospira chreensis]